MKNSFKARFDSKRLAINAVRRLFRKGFVVSYWTGFGEDGRFGYFVEIDA